MDELARVQYNYSSLDGSALLQVVSFYMFVAGYSYEVKEKQNLTQLIWTSKKAEQYWPQWPFHFSARGGSSRGGIAAQVHRVDYRWQYSASVPVYYRIRLLVERLQKTVH